MKISTKGRYALRLLLDLAEHKNDGYIALKDIANRQNVSKKYLEQIIPILNRSDILSANRGYQGGYMLTKPASEYSVYAILQVVEGSMAPVTCLEQQPINCPRCDSCKTLDVWQGLQQLITDYLGGITLDDVIERRVRMPKA